MATVPIQAIRELGTFGALGSLVVMGAALTFVPPILRSRRVWLGEGIWQRWISNRIPEQLVKLSRDHSRPVLFVWLVLGLVFGLGIPFVRVDTDIIRWFPRGSDTRESLEAIRGRLGGITAINVVLESEPGRAITEPSVLRAVRDLTNYIESLDEIGAAVSVADVVEQIHTEIGNDVGGAIPESRALVEQYLIVFPSAEYLRDLISDDREIANIMMRSNVNGSSQILKLAERIHEWWREGGARNVDVSVTGIMYEFGRAEDAIAHGQLRGLGLAMVAIAMILFALLRSFGSVLSALVPNMLPIVIVYGSMGFLGIPLDAATVCVGSIALGIAVDDTIHIAMGWKMRALIGADSEDALKEVLNRVLFPLVVTTISVAGGFLVLGISRFALIQNFGVVTASVVALCLLADLTLLPLLLKWARRGS
jgi:predicted RND superfamily exporter protein